MRVLSLIFMDIRNGISVVWHRGLLAGALFLLVNITLYSYSGVVGDQAVPLTLGDYYVNMFAGIKWSEFRPDRTIILPFMWLTVVLSILYFTLSYPHKDLEGIGKHLIVLSGSRLKWWYTKCLWVFIVVLLFFLTWIAITIIWILATQGSLDLTASANISKVLGLEQEVMLQPPWTVVDFIAVTFFCVLALCLFQMLVSLCLTPMLAFMTSITILILSIHSMSPFLIGNYLMATRSRTFVYPGLDSMTGIAISIGAILAVIVLGGWYFKHMDLLVKED